MDFIMMLNFNVEQVFYILIQMMGTHVLKMGVRLRALKIDLLRLILVLNTQARPVLTKDVE